MSPHSSSRSSELYRESTPWARPAEVDQSTGSAEEGGIDSPILVSPERAPDYAKMSMSSATPPPSDVGVGTYVSRAVQMVRKIHRMPWVVWSERVTVDYYPGKKAREESRREEDLYERTGQGHITSVSWKSRSYIAWRRSHYGHVGSDSSGEHCSSQHL